MNLALLEREQLEAILLDPPTLADDTDLDGTAALIPGATGCRRSQRIRHVLAAAHELLTRIAARAVVGRKLLDSPVLMKEYLAITFAGAERETFVVIFLDAHHRVIAAEEMFAGTATMMPVFPREVVKRALQHNAVALACAHCHASSGVAEPSHADRLITDKLRSALELVDVRLVDHFVVGAGSVVSFAEQGRL